MLLEPIERLSESQIEDLHALYQLEWWCKGRSLDEVQLMVENTSLIIGFAAEGRLVAFCRVLTDFVFHAIVYDVIVAENWRGRGLGARLMDAINEHPRLQKVNSISLWCLSDLVPFYERWGFRAFEKEPRWMVKAQREG